MSDAQLDVDFRFNTPEAKKQTDEIRKGAKAVNDEAKAGNKPLQEREGLLQRLRRRHEELRQSAEKTSSVSEIGKRNAEIQLFEREIARLTRIGRQGFDDMGNAIPDFNRPRGLIERLTVATNLYKRAILEATNPDQIAKYNGKLAQTQAEIARLTNIGKKGFDDQGRAMSAHEGILQRLQRAASLYSKGMLEATRPDNLEKYSQKLALVNAEMAKLTKGVNIGGGSGWNGLQNSINQISRELPAFTYSAQIGFMAISNNLPILIDEINKLRVANAALNAEGKKGVPVWRQVLSGLLSWQTGMMVGITLMTVYGKEIGNWVKALFTGKQAIDTVKASANALAKTMGDAGAEMAKATIAVEDQRRKFESSRKGIISKELALKSYNEGIGKVLGVTNDLNLAEERTIKNGDAYIEMMFKKAKAASIMTLYTEQMSKAAEELAKTDEQAVSYMSSGLINSSDPKVRELYRQNAERNRKDAAKQFNDMAGRYKELYLSTNAEIEEFAQKNGLKLDDKIVSTTAHENLYKSILQSRKDAMQKISELDREYARKSMDSDAEEIQALRDKFTKFREIIIEENAKIKAYNDKHRKNPIALIDLSVVDPIERRAVDDLRYSQSTEKLAKSYEDQKALFDQYQNYLKEAGEKEADKRFASDLSKIKSFYASLTGEINALQGKQMEVGLSGVETDRLNKLLVFLKQYNDDRQAEDDRYFLEALKANQTFEQKRQKIISDSEKAISALTSAGKMDEADVARRQRDESLKQLLKDEVENNDAYKRAIEAIDKSSDAMLLTAFQNGKDTVMRLIDGVKGATEAQKANLRKIFGDFFDKGIKEAKTSNLEEVSNMANGFGQLVSSSLDFASNLDDGWQSLTSMVSTAGQLSNMFGKMFDSASLKNAGSGLGIFGAVLGVGGAISNYFNQRRERENAKIQQQIEYSNERQLKSTEAITKMMERQLQLINDLYGTERIEKYAASLVEVEQNFNDLNRQLEGRFKMTGDLFTDSILTRLNNGESMKEIRSSFALVSKEWKMVTDIMNKIGNYERFSSLSSDINTAREELAKLQYQADLGDADAYTVALINQLQTQIDLYTETLNKMKEELTGVSFNAFTDGIVDMFANGKTDVDDFRDYFETQMQAAILKGFARDSIKGQMQDWYDLFAEFNEDGLTASEIKKLQEEGGFLSDGRWVDGYAKLIEQAKKDFDALSTATGIDFSNKSSSSLSTSGNVERITEQTGTEIVGMARASYDLGKQKLAAIQLLLSTANMSHDIFVQQLRHQAAIEANTAATVGELKNAVTELKAINKNTNSRGRTSEGMGL